MTNSPAAEINPALPAGTTGPLREYVGVFHVHTAYSDSAGRMPYVVDCAKRAGLDYVVVCDHNTLASKREGWEGWHDGVLLAIAVEVTSLKGHAVVFGLDRCAEWRHAHPDEYLPQVEQMGGVSFIAHPERSSRGKLYHKPQAWPHLRTDCYAGIEIWSYMHDWVEWAFPWHPIQGVRDPDAGIAGPHPAVLRNWDEVATRRHIAGVGALDAHEIRFPWRYLKWFLFRVLPTEFLFRTARTHVLTPEWSGDAVADVAALVDALAAGHCFCSHGLVGDAAGTRFVARRGDDVALMGDEVAAGDEREFVATLPEEAEITLRRNSEAVAQAEGRELVHRDARPGVYRIEARRHNRPWVFTNHIYVR